MTRTNPTRPRSQRRRRGGIARAALAVAALTAAACAGPQEPLDVGVKEVASDVILGSPESGSPAPVIVPPVAPVLVGPGTLPLLGLEPSPPASVPGVPTTLATTTTTAPPACPEADPLAPPRAVATTRPAAPPAARTTRYRVDGTFDVSGANARKGRLPSSSTRKVQAVRTTQTGFTYEVVAELAGTTTTTGYQVIPQSEVPGEAGIFITSVVVRSSTEASYTFRPPTPLKLMELPALPGTTWSTAATDPVTATTISWSGATRQKVKVDACGTPLDAYTVELTNGRIAGPSLQVEFKATYAIATQYGGISVRDTVVTQGREGLDTVARQTTSTAAEDPDPSRR